MPTDVEIMALIAALPQRAAAIHQQEGRARIAAPLPTTADEAGQP